MGHGFLSTIGAAARASERHGCYTKQSIFQDSSIFLKNRDQLSRDGWLADDARGIVRGVIGFHDWMMTARS